MHIDLYLREKVNSITRIYSSRNTSFYLRVNHQIRPWIFTGRSNSSLNYAKYQFSPWIWQTSIKKVPPFKCSVSHVDLSPYMLCCLVHVAKRKPRVQWLIWWIVEKFQFSLFCLIFLCYSNFAHVLPIRHSSHFIQKHQKRLWPFSFSLKLSPFSPLQNHHHLRQFSRFWSFCVRLWLKVTPFV